MSAPSIPNLLSLRGSRGGRGGRGRGRDGLGQTGIAHDTTIQGTDTDAAVSRMSAAALGYLDDPYAKFFVSNADGPTPRRLPIINRGTYTRTTALDRLINAFVLDQDHSSASQPRQIVSLGAGTDTRPFRLFSRQDRPQLIYHEVDFEVVCKKKLQTVQTSQCLSSILENISASEDGTSWSSQPSSGRDEYHFHGMDLRRLSKSECSEEEDALPSLAGLRTDVPTLVISECCLCYLSPSQASGVLYYFTSRIQNLATIIYEPIRPDDPFGKVMTSNLAARHIRMPTLSTYPEPSDQEARLRKAGFESVSHMTMADIWKKWVSYEGRHRVDGLEGLDEIEEWELLAAHYIVVWGSRGEGFETWRGLTEGDR